MAESTRRRVEQWSGRLARPDHALWLLFRASFAETLAVPMPIERVLVPFMVANRDRLWRTATAVTVGCLLASLPGYALGLWFFDTLGRQLVDGLAWSDALAQFRTLFASHGFWAIVAVGVLPIPFQIAVLAAGLAHWA